MCAALQDYGERLASPLSHRQDHLIILSVLLDYVGAETWFAVYRPIRHSSPCLSTQSKFASAVGMLELPTSTSNSRVFQRCNTGINWRDMRLSAAGDAGRLGKTILGDLILGGSMLVRVWDEFCCTLKYFVGYLDDIFYGIALRGLNIS